MEMETTMYINYKKTDPFYARESEKYERPIPSREYLIQCLDKLGEPVSLESLISTFRLRDDDAQEALRRRLIAMEKAGQIIRNRRKKYALVEQLELIRGHVTGHRDGFGFLIPDDGTPDLFLSPYQMRSLFPGDFVLARVVEDARGKREGIIVEVIERPLTIIVGRYFEEDHIAFVEPDHKTLTQDIVIPPGEQGNAKHGQFVAIELISQPSIRRQATGRVVEILGDHLSPGLEIEIAIRSHNIPYLFPADVNDQIKQIRPEVSEADKENRADLRKLPLVTIDGEDAQDFDDAVYAEELPKGKFRLFVAIADVSHYVLPDTPLDKEALSRGNSVYFPGRVVPMLPEILSNELCSLKPNTDRLCMVCEMLINADGTLKKYTFYNAVMHSRARLTYTEVTAMLAGQKKTKMALLPQLKTLEALYQKLYAQRAIRGTLEFETIETRIIFGKGKKIKSIVPVERGLAHKIIEECMLVANVSAAEFLKKHKMPTLYRVHGGPKANKIEKVQEFLNGMGLHLGQSGTKKISPMDYFTLFKKIEHRPDVSLIQTVLLRSLMQAIYTPDNTGHFGLAYETYTHFTSPIRRYPDLLVHRAIKHLIQLKKPKTFMHSIEQIKTLGEHCSMTERRADEATRDATDWLKCHYIQSKIGKSFDGIITAVTGFGIFVALKDIYVEGLVHITALKSDYYHFDPVKHMLKGKSSGTIYRLGDPVRVLVARVDLDQKEIHFELS
jgi:ribonuclease R